MHWLCNDANGLTKQISVLLTTWGLCIKSSFQSQSSRLSMFKRTLEPLPDLLLPHLAEVPCGQSCLAVRLSTYWLWRSGCRYTPPKIAQDFTVILLSLVCCPFQKHAWVMLNNVYPLGPPPLHKPPCLLWQHQHQHHSSSHPPESNKQNMGLEWYFHKNLVSIPTIAI